MFKFIADLEAKINFCSGLVSRTSRGKHNYARGIFNLYFIFMKLPLTYPGANMSQ